MILAQSDGAKPERRFNPNTRWCSANTSSVKQANNGIHRQLGDVHPRKDDGFSGCHFWAVNGSQFEMKVVLSKIFALVRRKTQQKRADLPAKIPK
jgi:hypothetical protein